MRKLLTGLLLINITCVSQTVKKLEYELSFYKSGEEWGNKKNVAFKLLGIDSLNSSAINYLVEVYDRKNQKDSINFLFERLINENPQNSEPYLLIAQERNLHFAELSYPQQINYLKEAYKLDSVNVEVVYTLGKLYYELFNKEFKTNKKRTNPDFYSSNAIQYFSIKAMVIRNL